MRTLYDPKSLARQDSPLNRGSVPLGGVPKKRATAVVSAPAAKPAPASATSGRPTLVSGRGLSASKFFTQLVGKLGKRTLLAGP